MSNKQFDLVQVSKPPSSRFDLSHEKKLSCQMGELIPIYEQQILPGDKFKVKTEIMLRLAPMLAPIMHRVNIYTHFFFVPNRLVWNEWEDFITGGRLGTSEPQFPILSMNDANKDFFQKGLLSDYMGLPDMPETAVTQSAFISALPFRAYQMIYNEYYRDQNLTPEIDFQLGSDANTDIADLTLTRTRAWEKDYFTSALPFAQRGGEVNLPIQSTYTPTYLETSKVFTSLGGAPDDFELQTEGADSNLKVSSAIGDGRIENLDGDQGITNQITIEQLRQAVRLQEWLEKNARGGARYTESMLVHFGVKSSDARLQRPEYLGGGKQPIIISEVLQTAPIDDTGSGEHTPLAEMAGHGISIGQNSSFSRYFEEHGTILGIMSVLPRTTYQQGINRHWLKFDKFDYAWPEFAQLGEQEIENRELYMDFEGTTGQSEETFGYQSRYAEYKYKESQVHGDFKDNLAFWHMGRIFTGPPALNTNFIESDPTQRIFAVEDETLDKLYIQIYNSVSAIRPLPKFNNPKL